MPSGRYTGGANQLPWNCVCTSGQNMLANSTHISSVRWDGGDDAAVTRTECLSMNIRYVLVVSLVFVPYNHKREELAWKSLVSRGGSDRFQASLIHWKQARQRALEEIHSTTESRSSRRRSSSSLSAEKSVAFLVPKLGMYLTLLSP